jgi:hypothetical protein
MMTTYERGKLAGQLESAREMVVLSLEAKFGSLTSDLKRQVEALSLDQLRQLALDLLRAASLKELGLQE